MANVALPLLAQDPQETVATGAWLSGTAHPNQKGHESYRSWELQPFGEGTNSLPCSTWPRRSYACTFCKREFRSAQALGGHMNVHRRDRARYAESPPSHAAPTFVSSTMVSNSTNYPPRALCFVYPAPPQDSSFLTIASVPSLGTNSSFIKAVPSLISSPPTSSASVPYLSITNSICPPNNSNMLLSTSGAGFQKSFTGRNTSLSAPRKKSSKPESVLDLSLGLCSSDTSGETLQTAGFQPYQATCLGAKNNPQLRQFNYETKSLRNMSVNGLDLELRLGYNM